MRTSPSGWGCREGGGRAWMHLKYERVAERPPATPAEECFPAAPWVTPSDLAAHAVRRCCCQGMLGACKAAGKRRPGSSRAKD